MLLTEMKDVDDHLDMLEDVDSYVFKLSVSEMIRFRSKPFFDRVEKKILSGDKDDSILLIEEPPRRWDRYTQKSIKALGRRVDGKKNHQIHAFFIPSAFFELLTAEVTDWD